MNAANPSACQTCRFWERAPDPVDGTELGMCRRFPPTYDGWPMTGPDDWCGEYDQNESVCIAPPRTDLG
jgi:hypothetical protein